MVGFLMQQIGVIDEAWVLEESTYDPLVLFLRILSSSPSKRRNMFRKLLCFRLRLHKNGWFMNENWYRFFIARTKKLNVYD